MIEDEIRRLTQKPEVSRAIREELQELSQKERKKESLLLYSYKRKHEVLKSLKQTYRILCIQQENWWDKKKLELQLSIDKATKMTDYSWMDTMTYKHIYNRNMVGV